MTQDNTPHSPPAQGQTEFPCDPLAIRAARNLVVRAVREQGWRTRDVERAQLATSELAANAVMHARSAFTLRWAVAEQVRIEVVDHDGASDPRPRETDIRRGGGMGLRLISQLSTAWGVDRAGGAKTVWCEIEPLAVGADAPPVRVPSA